MGPAFLAVAVMTLTGAIAGQASARDRIVILPVQMLDTSGEVGDQKAAHDSRALVLSAALVEGLAGSARYEPVDVGREELAVRCPVIESACLVALVREKRGTLLLLPMVHKSSTLILSLHAKLIDVSTDRTVLARELSFRGDTDEAWQHAGRFLARQIGD